ncbi:Dolichyldiphosphatase 1 [Phytophthora boehmeriae]|uniref:Dolichyldiphosphatase n=1 Tax=Phytophthora boehmeriae TaxID=109152 RepID=A0A8T1WWS9_9STRA|nr:Dolichyldiphosphatase 1 [Phytophthora boehmeriae]
MEEQQEQQAFELTWVVYDPTDPWGIILALFTLSPIFIMIMYATLVTSQRDLDTISMLTGQMITVVLNKVLKKIINQPRPEGAPISDSGMPSAHSQFVAFFAAYLVAYTLKRMNSRRRLEQWGTIVSVLVMAVLTCYSRIHLGYHSTEQVAVGAVFGALTGFAWHAAVSSVSPWLFPQIAQSRLAQLFYVRDISHIPDLVVHQHDTCPTKATAASPGKKSQ